MIEKDVIKAEKLDAREKEYKATVTFEFAKSFDTIVF